MKSLVLILSLCLLSIISSCSSQKAFTGGSYEDPNQETMLDDRFNESDVQKISSVMIESLGQCSKYSNKRAKVILGEIANNTTEHMDLEMIMVKIKTSLLKNNKFYFLDNRSRIALNEEIDYQKDSGRVLSSTQKDPKGQLGADYMLTGTIHSNVQQFDDMKKVYYYVSLNLTNIETGMIDCTEEKELKKSFKQKSY